jgi:hypothetical protein
MGVNQIQITEAQFEAAMTEAMGKEGKYYLHPNVKIEMCFLLNLDPWELDPWIEKYAQSSE